MALEDARGERLMLELQAREAWNQRDYAEVQSLAEHAAAAAVACSDEVGWWNATFLVSEALRKQGLMQASRDIADRLGEHELTAGSAALSARVATLRSFALQGCGDLALAVRSAQEAVSFASDLIDHKGIRMEAQNALIAALADSDQLADAWREGLVLAELLSTEPSSQTAGLGYWAIGNVAFLLNRISEGVSYHQLAAQNLSPGNDLDLWARFNRASASLRLTAGVAEPETLECIERAEMAGSIAGGNERDRLELALTRAQWLVLTEQFDVAVEQLSTIVEHKHHLASHIAAQAHFLLGQALSARNSDARAVLHLELSEDLFLQSGAEDRASAAREFIRTLQEPQA